MADLYRRLFLDQVEVILQREQSRESLLALLQLATPGLSGLGDGGDAEKAFKALLTRVHPDKHPRDASRATRLCQEIRPFYDRSMASSPTKKRKKRASSSPRGSSFPLEFNAINKWPHIEYNLPYAKPEMKENEMSHAVAYQCINARGAIAHGRKIEFKYINESKISSNDTAKKVIKRHGGSKELRGSDEIKEEIMTNGPVVSTSFSPSETFLRNNTIGKSNHCHQTDILIVGWGQQSYGEVWTVQPLHRNGSSWGAQVAHVAVGQLGLEDCCLAPLNDFGNTSWQEGPYFDGEMGSASDEWLSWKQISFPVDSMSVLDPLFREKAPPTFTKRRMFSR
ncbi:hypothetical protein ACHAWF_016633 [Thalassiosira exigua]